MRLTGAQVRQVQDAFTDAFDPDSLYMMVRTRLDADLNDIAADANMRRRVFDLIEWAERQGRTRDLIAAACAEMPGNAQIRALDPLLQALDQPPAPPPAVPAEQPASPLLSPAPDAPSFASAVSAVPAAPAARAVLTGPPLAGSDSAPAPAAPSAAAGDSRNMAILRGVLGGILSFMTLGGLLAAVRPDLLAEQTTASNWPIALFMLAGAALGIFFYPRRSWRAVWITLGAALVALTIAGMLIQ